MTSSLRRRLLLFLLSTSLVVWSGTAVWNFFDSRHQIEALFDAQLAQSAKALLSLSRHELYEQLAYEGRSEKRERNLPEHVLGDAHPYEQSVAFQIWLDKDYLAVRSNSAPRFPLSDELDSFGDREIDGTLWRVYCIADEELPMVVHVGEHYDRRSQLINAITLRLLMALLVALPILAITIWVGVGHALRPLQRLAREVESRRVDALDPVSPTSGVPDETRPLINALNALFGRVARALENERRFTADAAHELRTPLAALKTQAQVALRAQAEPERRAALQQVVHGVNRATHLVEQLLTLARLDPQAQKVKDLARQRVDLCAAAAAAIGDIAPEALVNKIELGLDENCRGTVTGDAAMLETLIRNLVGNAVRYTPAGGQVAVSIEQRDGVTALRVADSGPGIPEPEREKVFRRFYRQLGTAAPGSGLGLSIVQRIAEIHDATIRLDTSHLGGLLVEVQFPASS